MATTEDQLRQQILDASMSSIQIFNKLQDIKGAATIEGTNRLTQEELTRLELRDFDKDFLVNFQQSMFERAEAQYADLLQQAKDLGIEAPILDPFSGLEKSEVAPEGTQDFGQPLAGPAGSSEPSTPAPSAPPLFSPPTFGTGGGLPDTGSTARIGGGSSTSGNGSGGSANISDVAQSVSDDIPTGGQILSDVGASILKTRANIESLINRRKKVGFGSTRLAAADTAVVARRTLLAGGEREAAIAKSSEGKVKGENIFKGSSKIGTILGRSK